MRDLASFVWSNVVCEPVVCDKSNLSDGTLVADLWVSGVWFINLRRCLIYVWWTLAPGLIGVKHLWLYLVLLSVIKRKNTHRLVRIRRGHPLCVLVDSMMGHEATAFLQWITDMLSAEWEMNYRLVMEWICTRLSFAILRAKFLCISGCCTTWS